MRTIVIALAGLLVVGAIGGAAIAMLPTSDSTPLEAIRVEAPQRLNPVTPAPLATPAPAPPAPAPTPTAAVPPPADSRGVPQPPPPVVQAPPRGDDDWDDDDDDWGGDDWDDD